MRLVGMMAWLGAAALLSGWTWAQEAADPYADWLRISREGKAHEFAKRLEAHGGSQDPALVATLAQCHEWVFTCDAPVRVDDILAGMRNPAAVEPLLDLYRKHPRDSAAFSLAFMGDTRVAPLVVAELMRHQRKDPDAIVPPGMADPSRDPALEEKDGFLPLRDVLVLIGPAAVEPLLPALESPDMRIRAIAAQALGRIGDPRAVEALGKSLGTLKEDARKDDEEDPYSSMRSRLLAQPKPLNARKEIVQALMRIGDPKAVPALVAAISEADVTTYLPGVTARPDGDATTSPCDALAVVGWLNLPALFDGLKSDKWYTRCCTLRIIGRFGLAEGRGPAATLVRDKDPRVRRAALAAVAKLGHPSAYQWVGEALHDPNEDTRVWAVECLALIAGDEAASRLRGVLGSTDASLRYAAMRTYTTCKDPEAVPALLRIAKRNTEESETALCALANNPPGADSVEWLIGFLTAKREFCVWQAADVLEAMNAPQAAKRLIDVVNNRPHYFINMHIINALLCRKDPRGVPLAIADLQFNAWRNFGMIISLAKTGDPRAVEPTIAALNGLDGSRRNVGSSYEDDGKSFRDQDEVLIYVLGLMKDPRAVTPLMAYLRRLKTEDALPESKEEAAPHLWPDGVIFNRKPTEGLGDRIVAAMAACARRDATPLLPFLGHKDATIRLAAARALVTNGDVRAVPALAKALSDDNARVADAAATALAHTNTPDAMTALFAATAPDRSMAVRASAFAAMGLARAALPADAEGRILAAMGDANERLSVGATLAAKHLTSEAARDLLRKRAEDAYADNAWAAASGAVSQGQPVGEAMLRMMRAPKWTNRAAAALLIGKLVYSDAIAKERERALDVALRDPTETVREGAVWSYDIGHVRGKEAALVRMLYADDPSAAAVAQLHWTLQRALQTKVMSRSPAETAALIGLLEMRNSDHGPVVDTLKAITGQNFGTDAPRWRRWWLDVGSKTAAKA